MKRMHAYQPWLWIIMVLTSLSIAAGIGLGQIQPSGTKAGLIQFDVISEWNLDGTKSGNVAVFARYWVCEDYYAVSVVWTEPHGRGVIMRTAIAFSDEAGFRMDNELFPDQLQTNATYPKPLGERPSFRWIGGFYGGSEMRFAEAQALARRVYVSDLGPAKSLKTDASGVVEVNVPKDAGGVTRNLARLKVHARDDRIESMELFDGAQQSLPRMQYEYEQDAGSPRISTLVAELPVRPEKLAVNASAANPSGTVPDADHLSHKGGRTCIVTYKDVTIGDKVLRLPVQVRVQRSDNKQLVRSARLMNFKCVDMDKAGVWEAAKAFGGLDSEYPTWVRLVDKFLDFQPRLGPPSADPNDLAVLRRLIAKYPVWEVPPGPRMSASEPRTQPESVENNADWQEQVQARRQERAKEQERAKKWHEDVAKMPRPLRKEIEPNDVRLIRQLRVHYVKRFSTIHGQVPDEDLELWTLSRKLPKILTYHRVAPLPEDSPPEPNDSDLKRIRRLTGHYERLTARQDQGLGGQLKALHALTCLDRMVKDYDALEGHAVRYLQMLRDTELNEMYMAGGYTHVETLIEAGRHEQAHRLFTQWVDRSAAANDADRIYRFCGSDLGGRRGPWAAVQLLDRFLKKPGLSPLQRYEALALRAISLDKIDKLLADPDGDDNESREAQVKWILKNTTRAEIARRVEPAIRQAVAAWESLGPARLNEARPYSTSNMNPMDQNMTEARDATRLQETSAQLDQIVRRRTASRGATPRSREAGQSGGPQ